MNRSSTPKEHLAGRVPHTRGDELTATATIVVGWHFPDPGAVHFLANGDGPRTYRAQPDKH